MMDDWRRRMFRRRLDRPNFDKADPVRRLSEILSGPSILENLIQLTNDRLRARSRQA